MPYRPKRFVAVTFVSFILSIVGSLFAPGAFLNRLLTIALCSVLGFQSNFLPHHFPSAPGKAVAATAPPSQTTLTNTVDKQKVAICLPIVGCVNTPLPDVIERNVIDKVLEREVQKALLNVVKEDIPVAISTDNLYPRVDKLPGESFHPEGSSLQPEDSILGLIQKMLQVSPDGSLELIPGDYTAKVYLYCFKPNAPGIPTQEYRSPNGHRYLLAPVKGKMSDVIRAINVQALGSGIPNSLINVLVWNIQVGVKYQDMRPEVKNIVDELIPEYRERLSYSFFEKILSTWNSVSSLHPGLPSFSESLDKLGDVGHTVKAIIQTREQLIRHGVNYFALSNDFIIPVSSDEAERFANVSWSKINDRLLARMVTKGRTAEPGVLQIRVLPEQGTQISKPKIFVETLENLKSPGIIKLPVSQANLKSEIDPLLYAGVKDLKKDEDDVELFVVNPSDLKEGAQIQGKVYKRLSRKALSALFRLGLKAVPIIGWGSFIYDLYDLYQWVAIPETHPDYKIQPAGIGFDEGNILENVPINGIDVAQQLCNKKRGKIPKGKVSAAINIVCNVADDTPRKPSRGNRGRNSGDDGGNGNRTSSSVVTRPPRLDPTKISPGMQLDPTKAAVFRGGRSFQLKPNEFKVDPVTKLVKPTHGVSLDANPVNIERFGGAHQIRSIPKDLMILQRGGRLEHFEIVPRQPMSVEKFQELLNKIEMF